MNMFCREICWVYIIESSTIPGKRSIVFCTDQDMPLSVERHLSDGGRLVYRRRFDNVFDALAHKLMLENLSHNTISHVIHHQA